MPAFVHILKSLVLVNFDQLYSEREPVYKDFSKRSQLGMLNVSLSIVFIFVVYFVSCSHCLLFDIVLFSTPVGGGDIKAQF